MFVKTSLPFLLFLAVGCGSAGSGLTDGLVSLTRDAGRPTEDSGPGDAGLSATRDVTLTVFIKDQSTWDGGRGRTFGGPTTIARARWQLADGGWGSSTGYELPDSGYLIPDVPRGESLISFPTIGSIVTDADHLDCTANMHGRADAPTAANSPLDTLLVVEVENMPLMTSPTDTVWLYSAGGPVLWSTLVPPNSNGSFTYNFRGVLLPLLSGSRGDLIWFTINKTTASTTFSYDSPALIGSVPAPDMTIGTDHQVSLRLAPPTRSTLDVSLDVPAFERAVTSQRPGAVVDSATFTLEYVPNLNRIGRVGRGWYGNESKFPLVEASFRAGAPQATGPISWPDAFPRSDLLATMVASMPVTLQNGGRTTTIFLRHVKTTRLGIPPFNLEPGLGPATALAIGGQPATNQRSGVGLTPTLSWAAPATGTVDHYEVQVVSLDPSTGNPSTLVGKYWTRRTEFTIPPETLVVGRSYFAGILALAGAYRPLVPTYLPPESEESRAATGVFSP